MKHLILATAGHVDHGKSSLVKALTGTDPDRLPEEKARQITIDLGFAFLSFSAEEAGEPTELGLVDVPGHEDFLKNMIAGVGAADMALLVVAADDGWMPQTEEHLQILAYFGVGHAVVALTKADLATDLAAVRAEVQARLQASPYAAAPIIATALADFESVGSLRRALAALAASTPAPRNLGKPRLPIDRAFTVVGAGVVVTGTLLDGSLCPGEACVVQPNGMPTRIRTVQNRGKELHKACPGMRVALNLADVRLAGARGEPGVQRGQVITRSDAGTAVSQIFAALESSPRLAGIGPRRTPALRSGSSVVIHQGSSHTIARLQLLGAKELAPGAHAFARLRFEQPLFAFVGDRFVLRDSSGRHTLAGGHVLDLDLLRIRSAGRERRLSERTKNLLDPATLVRTEVEVPGVAALAGFLQQTRVSEAEIHSAIRQLAAAGELALVAGRVASAAWWKALKAQVTAFADDFHRRHPERRGAGSAELRAALPKVAPELLSAAVAELQGEQQLQRGNLLGRAGYRPVLPENCRTAGTRIRQTLADQPLEPPSRKLLVQDSVSHQALRFLIANEEVVEISPDVVLATPAFERARDTIVCHLQQKGSATAADLRQALGTTRRILVPLLEYCDRIGVTKREGDLRVLKQAIV